MKRLIFCLFLFIQISYGDRFYLDGYDWTFRSLNTSLTGYAGQANVPGDIYTDLYRNGLINNPLYGNGDHDYRWVGRTGWIYEKIFDLQSNVINSNDIVLVFESLDTIVDAYLNNQHLFTSKNQFTPVQISVKTVLQSTQNNLTLVFQSPVEYAINQSIVYQNKHNHDLPPDISNGGDPKFADPHPNFIRKTQSSFSWDWGPSFPTVGVARSAYLEYFANAAIYQVAPLITKNQADSFFKLQADVYVLCQSGTTATIALNITEVNLATSQTFTNINCVSGVPQNLSQAFNVPTNAINLWYPNGYGPQTLYTLNTQVIVNGNTVSQSSIKIGFRTIELVQDNVTVDNDVKGYTFYFKVNDIPIFLKGSNYIPIDPFSAQNFTLRKQFLLKSMQESNMNALRIWGGGLFEMDEFYNFADEYGILLWHDHMFGCAAYSADDDFIQLVLPEFTNQVARLRYHPSILLWAGNNENEIAITTTWWHVTNYNETLQIQDYKTLYVENMRPLITSLDPSRPFVYSSPTNGRETDEEGGVSLLIKSSSSLYGDVHSYTYSGNIWKDSIFQTPRCASEYGAQSLPLKGTMAHWVKSDEWTHGSYWLKARQHHGYGNEQNLNLTFLHFEPPPQCEGYTVGNDCPYINSSTTFLEEYSYLTQILQAIAMQAESEHYRRYRASINHGGYGYTMCALYWQLNDVWAAPTWASIDYDLNWKVLHYYAKRFFAPLIVSLYFDNSMNLTVYVVSDEVQSRNGGSLQLDVFTWENGLTPIFSSTKSVDIMGLNTTQLDFQSDITAKGIILNENDTFVIRAVLKDQNGASITPTAILLPDYMKQVSNTNYGDATITSVTQVDPATFNVTLTASKIVPILWLDIKPEVKLTYQLKYWFSDNAFTMTDPQVTVQLKIFSSIRPTVTLTTQDFIVSRMKMSSSQTTTPTPNPITLCINSWHKETTAPNKCLISVPKNEARSEASFDCSVVGNNASLLSIGNAFENSEITQTLQGDNNSMCTQYYIGLYRNGSSWSWSNSDPSTYRNWNSGAPLNDNTKNCAVVEKQSGTWYNVACYTFQCYICQQLI